MNHSQLPTARKEGLVIQEMPAEVLVYDLATNKAHCLNRTAAFVWKACDGKNTVAEITRLAGAEAGAGVPEDLVWLAIEQLSEKNLLTSKMKADFGGSTRREVIKKVGLAAVVGLPLVASLTAPTSVLAASSCTCPNGIGDCQNTPGCPSVACTGGLCRSTNAPESGTITIREDAGKK